ncbi:hypothetical protein [Flavobacterium sp. UBA7680]|uniref:hypothetical protein n=1 Tax=Flavobacterium sp. UBA7680 TaxID=1946559 RepID=UPI0025BE97D7|nr:hypothetical protein [Flavobacterium sp. UBA7680]
MSSITKYLFINLVLFTFAVNAQNNQKKYSGLLPEVNNRYAKYGGKNLKDSVKAVYLKFNGNTKILSDNTFSNYFFDHDFQLYKYISIDEYGSIKAIQKGFSENNYISNIDYKATIDYKYDPKDRAKKSKYKTDLKPYYPVASANLFLKSDQEFVLKGDFWGNVDDSYEAEVFVYKYDNLGKITTEKRYIVSILDKSFKGTLPDDSRDLYAVKTFSYNTKGQVINQKIAKGSFTFQKKYADMGTEIDFYDDLELQYQYDLQGRIVQIIMYGNKKILAQEDYIYNATKDYVEKVKYYVTGKGEYFNGTKNLIKTFNEHGDVIEKEFLPVFRVENSIAKHFFYSYDYDSHNNWIKCNLFLEGKKEGKPTLVAERKIEYYN